MTHAITWANNDLLVALELRHRLPAVYTTVASVAASELPARIFVFVFHLPSLNTKGDQHGSYALISEFWLLVLLFSAVVGGSRFYHLAPIVCCR
jgi:hypothetical protein